MRTYRPARFNIIYNLCGFVVEHMGAEVECGRGMLMWGDMCSKTIGLPSTFSATACLVAVTHCPAVRVGVKSLSFITPSTATLTLEIQL
jgi:hypothetical protein